MVANRLVFLIKKEVMALKKTYKPRTIKAPVSGDTTGCISSERRDRDRPARGRWLFQMESRTTWPFVQAYLTTARLRVHVILCECVLVCARVCV